MRNAYLSLLYIYGSIRSPFDQIEIVYTTHTANTKHCQACSSTNVILPHLDMHNDSWLEMNGRE